MTEIQKKMKRKYVYLECSGYDVIETATPIKAFYTPVCRNPRYCRTPCRIHMIIMHGSFLSGYLVERPGGGISLAEKWEIVLCKRAPFPVIRKYEETLMVSRMDTIGGDANIDFQKETLADFERILGKVNSGLRKRIIVYPNGEVWGESCLGITGTDTIRKEVIAYLGGLPKLQTLPGKTNIREMSYKDKYGKTIFVVADRDEGIPAKRIALQAIAFALFPDSGV